MEHVEKVQYYPIPPKQFFIINGRGCNNKVALNSSRTSEPKQDDNEREREMVRKG
jgi:hypothetical protein